MACSSPRIPGGITRRAGIAGVMGCITTSNHGARLLNRRGSRSWSTTIVRRGYRLSGSLGLRAFGGRPVYQARSPAWPLNADVRAQLMARSRHTDPPRIIARRVDAQTGMARARVVE